MPSSWNATILADTTLYPTSASNLRSVSLANDTVFGDKSAAQLAQQTPTITGSAAAGLVATALIGIAR